MILAPPNATPTLSVLGCSTATANGDGTITVTDTQEAAALMAANWVKVDASSDSDSVLATSLRFNSAAGSQFIPLIFV